MKSWNRRHVVVVESLPLTDLQIAEALQGMTDSNPVWRGILQKLGEAIQAANEASRATVGDAGVCASYCGGAEHLETFRDWLIGVRQQKKLK